MLEMIRSKGNGTDRRLPPGVEVTGTEPWEETMAMLVTKVLTTQGHYFILVITNEAGQEDVEVLAELEDELGKKLEDCLIVRKRHDKAHPDFPRCKYFDVVTVYAD